MDRKQGRHPFSRERGPDRGEQRMSGEPQRPGTAARTPSRCRSESARWLAGAVGLAGASYAAVAAVNWCRYGRAAHLAEEEGGDALLECLLPRSEVVYV